ncbi:hypothetical protein [Bacillus pseudomycoides]|uniref:hypothetical protein n=1 Tax=Bacillus pseudomycoides TaxID=64104 RepID=UPI0015CF5BA2|nr:hypothetical protein [Bacillus pseudomycoides]
MFFKKDKRIKELEEKVSELEKELEQAYVSATDLHLELQYRDWEEDREERYQNDED